MKITEKSKYWSKPPICDDYGESDEKARMQLIRALEIECHDMGQRASAAAISRWLGVQISQPTLNAWVNGVSNIPARYHEPIRDLAGSDDYDRRAQPGSPFWRRLIPPPVDEAPLPQGMKRFTCGPFPRLVIAEDHESAARDHLDFLLRKMFGKRKFEYFYFKEKHERRAEKTVRWWCYHVETVDRPGSKTNGGWAAGFYDTRELVGWDNP